MQDHIVERVEGWDARPFSGGVRELHGLADSDFSGAVSAAGTWVFMLNGRVIGVFDGVIGDVEGADGTVYEAPDESVALLSVMQERGGETQAKYYTNDTPLSEADGTLADANFTGYIELSENVMSGDYYVVYYGGRSMSAAFVGASEQLVTGDDAFERADDEVGVYEVKKTPVNVTSLPEIEDEDEDEDDAAAAGAAAAGAAATDEESEPTATETQARSDATDDSAERTERAETPDESTTADSDSGQSTATGPEPDERSADPAGGASAQSASTETPSESNGDESADGAAGGAAASASSADSENAGGKSAATTNGGAAADDGSLDEEREWRNARSVPTLDPDESTTDASEDDDGDAAAKSASGSRTTSASRPSQSNRSSSRSPNRQSGSGSRSKLEKLRQAVKQRDEKLTAATDRIENLESEREDLQDRVDELKSERDELQAKVEELEADLEAASSSPASPEGVELSPRDALAGTNLFVRYDSKGNPTLDELDASTDRNAVNDNMRIEHHTKFDAADASVDGEPFEEFLRGTPSYRFVSWAVRALPYEIRDAGHESGLSELYEALPQVDRAELDGTVEVEPDEETSVSRTFDVVLRDRMGNPLLVADLATGREPVSGPQMDALVEDASAIREGTDDLAAAMYVTGSFFEPAALEVADDETGGGGFLSRSDKESYVKVGRKSGYHLCLVEDRNDAFHLTVPEL